MVEAAVVAERGSRIWISARGGLLVTPRGDPDNLDDVGQGVMHVVTERSELNEEEKRRFHAWMKQHDVGLRCPICGYTSFVKHERVGVLSMNDRAPLHGYSAAVQIECERCGYRLRFGGRVAEQFFWPATER